MTHYHFSYDTIDCKNHFAGNYDEAKRYLLCTLLSIPAQYLQSIGAFCESTLIIKLLDKDSDRFFTYIKANLSTYFYFVVTEITIVNGKLEYDMNSNKTLTDNFIASLKTVVCDNLLQGIKTRY